MESFLAVVSKADLTARKLVNHHVCSRHFIIIWSVFNSFFFWGCVAFDGTLAGVNVVWQSLTALSITLLLLGAEKLFSLWGGVGCLMWTFGLVLLLCDKVQVNMFCGVSATRATETGRDPSCPIALMYRSQVCHYPATLKTCALRLVLCAMWW